MRPMSQTSQMSKSLWVKFLVVLVMVAVVGLSSTFLLRELMVKDFIVFLESEMEDRVDWLAASLVGSFENNLEWKTVEVSDALAWAAMMGIEARLHDVEGDLLMDTDRAIERLPFYVQKRVRAIVGDREATGSFTPNSLSIGGTDIGRLEVRFHAPGKETQYIKRSNLFLLMSILALGGVALIMSFVFSRRLTKPIQELTEASSALASGDFTHRVGVTSRDEISQLARSFNRMAEQLAIQDALRKKLSANVAHELRTPLGAVRGELEGMIDGLISPEKDNLRSVYDEIGRMRIVLDGMEELAQAEASGLSLNLNKFEIGPYLKDITDRYRRMFEDGSVSLSLEFREDLMVTADPEKLSQVVINLLSNSLRATPEGGEVTVSARGVNDGGIRISVADSGSGIMPEFMPFIFERYYRAREGGGLGIGLTIVKELVEAHGGRVTASSIPDEGSVFNVFLPG